MTLTNPLIQQHLARGGTLMPYPDPADPSRFAEVVEAFDPIELEYAAIRKGCVLIDQPQRGTIAVTGEERVEFLNRMFTQELKGLSHWESRRSFWLNRKGRIDADLRLTALPEAVRLDLDIHAVGRTIEALDSYVFSEDVSFTDESARLHRLGLHGPAAIARLGVVAEHRAGVESESLGEGHTCEVAIAGHGVLVERHDWLGEIGLELTCEASAVAEVYAALLGESTANGETTERMTPRPIGWHACNIARIEAGTPLYYLDFGAKTLPHETGVLRDRVSFTKGCYLGQEIVARMEALGKPKQLLVGLRFDDGNGTTLAPDMPQPLSGDEVFADMSSDKPIGQVTSSTISPMLGSAPICFALVRHAHASLGTKLLVVAEGERIGATVQPGLVFWERG